WFAQVEEVRTTKEETKDKITDIRLQDDLIVASHQHRKIKVNITGSNKLIFDSEKSLKDKRKCFAYLVEDEMGKNKFINIYNASNFPKLLKRNTIIGYITEIRGDSL
ncbi:hypothetical protein, partial [Klebsiella pneumoniae]|uniref:hypothetical protein n=1 Tax=Klebsiella pneumoniae TaxID=573 RepID=UPI001C8F43CB